mmetsp:Transcript_13248/g.20701  ORF Transcript_13248/g.20701 Transcript_13248/m.20701 type:complete len:132 (-) Transcript_13248:5186-5581(-)
MVSFRPNGEGYPHTATVNSPTARLEDQQNPDLNPLASCQNKDKPIELGLQQIGESPKLQLMDKLDQSPYFDGNYDNMLASYNAAQGNLEHPPAPTAQHRHLSFGSMGAMKKKKLKGRAYHEVAEQLKQIQD